MATKYVKHPEAEWRIIWLGGQTVVEAEPDKEAVYIPRVGVFVKAPDIHMTRMFIPTRSLIELRSLWRGSGKENKDGLAKWVEEQFLTTAEKFARRDATVFDE